MSILVLVSDTKMSYPLKMEKPKLESKNVKAATVTLYNRTREVSFRQATLLAGRWRSYSPRGFHRSH